MPVENFFRGLAVCYFLCAVDRFVLCINVSPGLFGVRMSSSGSYADYLNESRAGCLVLLNLYSDFGSLVPLVNCFALLFLLEYILVGSYVSDTRFEKDFVVNIHDLRPCMTRTPPPLLH